MNKKIAVSYLRVRGNGQIDKNGFDRQKDAISRFADKEVFLIRKIYKEMGVSGTKDESERPAFQLMITEMLNQGIDTIIVESMDRLARTLQVQEQLCLYLASKNINLYSANTGENITKAIKEDPMKKALIQIQGVFSELDKNLIIKKLKAGRKKAAQKNQKKGIVTLEGKGKCEGRKSWRERNADLVRETKKLRRMNPKTKKRKTYSQITDELFILGFRMDCGKEVSLRQVRRICHC